MSMSSTDVLLSQLNKCPLPATPKYAEFIELLVAFSQRRPAIDAINTEDTVVVCRREILAEAISYYRAKYSRLPVFYTFSPDTSLYSPSSDLIVKDFEDLTPEHKVHIFTSITARRPGHSGISFLVRQLANKGILTPSVELNSIERFCNSTPPVSFTAAEFDSMMQCYAALKDEDSKEAFLGACKARLTGDSSFIPLALYPQYFHPKVPIESGDILCEGGICDGKTSNKFAKAVGEEGKIFGFEPVPECYAVSVKRTRQHSNIQLTNKALWKEEGTLPLHICEPTSGYSSIITPDASATSECLTTSIDAFFDDKTPPTVIKLDVEGAEIPVLEGALKTIRAHRPKLILSIYHTNNGNDLLNVPQFIMDLDLNYTLYVGHHSVWFNETILYATAD